MPELKYHHVGIPTNRMLPEEDYIKESQRAVENVPFVGS